MNPSRARLLVVAGALVLSGLHSRDALAEPTETAVSACSGHRVGDSCEVRVTGPSGSELAEPGVCADDTCCELDYSSGSPPKATCHPCLACQAASASAASTPPREDEETTMATPSEPGHDSPPATSGPTARGCRVAPMAGGANAWSLALLGLLVLRRRRQPQTF